MSRIHQVGIALGLGVAVVTMAFAQNSAAPLTLRDAANIALEKNPLRKAALADTKAAATGVREARSFLVPHVTFSEQATRGNDPVYVFGSKLRQQRFTIDDFSLNKLNTPLPYGNFATHFGGIWNLFDSFASWRGIERARAMTTAANHQLERTDQEILFRVVQSYYGVLLATKQLEVAKESEKTAQSIMDRSQIRFDAGLVVESDLLSAKVRLARCAQDLIRARNNLELARAQLNTSMGVGADSEYQAADTLAEQNLPVSADCRASIDLISGRVLRALRSSSTRVASTVLSRLAVPVLYYVSQKRKHTPSFHPHSQENIAECEVPQSEVMQ